MCRAPPNCNCTRLVPSGAATNCAMCVSENVRLSTRWKPSCHGLLFPEIEARKLAIPSLAIGRRTTGSSADLKEIVGSVRGGTYRTMPMPEKSGGTTAHTPRKSAITLPTECIGLISMTTLYRFRSGTSVSVGTLACKGFCAEGSASIVAPSSILPPRHSPSTVLASAAAIAPHGPAVPMHQRVCGDESIERLSVNFVQHLVPTKEPDEGASHCELLTRDCFGERLKPPRF